MLTAINAAVVIPTHEITRNQGLHQRKLYRGKEGILNTWVTDVGQMKQSKCFPSLVLFSPTSFSYTKEQCRALHKERAILHAVVARLGLDFQVTTSQARAKILFSELSSSPYLAARRKLKPVPYVASRAWTCQSSARLVCCPSSKDQHLVTHRNPNRCANMNSCTCMTPLPRNPTYIANSILILKTTGP